MTCIKNALPRHCYTATLTLSTDNPDVPAVTLSLDERISTDNVTIRLTPALLAAKAPEIHCEGFADGSPLHITEGSVPDHSIAATVDAASLLSGLFLSTNSPTLLAGGWPAEINLMEASESDMAAMRSFGLALVQFRPTEVLQSISPRWCRIFGWQRHNTAPAAATGTHTHQYRIPTGHTRRRTWRCRCDSDRSERGRHGDRQLHHAHIASCRSLA